MSIANPEEPQAQLPSYTWPETQTYVYKRVGELEIEVDVLVQLEAPDGLTFPKKRPILLHIHGGAWIGGVRTKYCQPLLYEFLQRGFVVASTDYRLLPESDFRKDQLDDIASAETWLRETLPVVLKERGLDVEVDSDSIVVAGGSAGALLTAFTPKIWKIPPKALLLIAGPTNMLDLPHLNRPLAGGRLGHLNFPSEASPELLKASIQPSPSTNVPSPKSLEDTLSPRVIMPMILFRKGVIAEFLLRGIIDGGTKLPEKGSVAEEEIKSISPIHFPLSELHWPPTYQIIGDMDEAFDQTHVLSFDDKLRSLGIPSETAILPGKSHAFETQSQVGDEIHEQVIKPAAQWVAGFV